MLDDNARKVLIVLWNTFQHKPSKINVPYLSQRSQRSEDQIKDAINLLVKEGFVLWDRNANTFQILYSREHLKPRSL